MKIKTLVLVFSIFSVGCVGIKPQQAIRYESDVIKIEVQKVLAGSKKYQAKIIATNKQNRSVMWHMQSMECYQGNDKGVVSHDVVKKTELPVVSLKPGEKFKWSVFCILPKSTDDYHTNYSRRFVINGIYVNPDSIGLLQGDELEKKIEFNLYDPSDILYEAAKPANLANTVTEEKEENAVKEAEEEKDKKEGTIGSKSTINNDKKTSPDTFKRAKKCQSKGGVWINDTCQLDIDD
jgi:hypothetical protein